MITGPIVGCETLLGFDAAYFCKELSKACVVTATQMPGKDFTPYRVIGFPDPNFLFGAGLDS